MSVNWYALGVLIFEILSVLPPFYEPDIAQRPTCIDCPVYHPSTNDLILGFVERDPLWGFGNMHNGAGDVFAHLWFAEVDWNKLSKRAITAPHLSEVTTDGDTSAFARYHADS